MLKDSIVHLYTGKSILNKSGNIHDKEELVETDFRLIILTNKIDEKEYWLLAKDFKLRPK